MPPKRGTVNSFLFFLIILSVTFSTAFYSYISLPSKQRLVVGDTINIPKSIPNKLFNGLTVYFESEKSGVLQIDGYPVSENTYKYHGGAPVVVEPGQLNLNLKLFGLIPLKRMIVDVVPQIKVIPGGHSVGILLQTDGVMVVGHSPVYGTNGEKCYPAKDAGIEIGDSLISINGTKIKSDKHAAKLINKYGDKGNIKIEIKNMGKITEVQLNPKYCDDTKSYRIGLYIRDNAAGVGTLTFYEPKGGKYGALGHMIADLDTITDSRNKGNIVKADIQGIQPGKKGQPGEKIGMFIDENDFGGSIEQNTTFGIFGKLKNPLNNPLYRSSISVALANQIEEGNAEIITVIEGDKLEKFNIKILKVLPQHQPTGKGLIIQITDPKLLQITGGIVQGMSGSPIIQNNKLVGAVTHVFVNDPTKGYGCLAEWMLLEAGLVRQDAYTKTGDFFEISGFSMKNVATYFPTFT